MSEAGEPSGPLCATMTASRLTEQTMQRWQLSGLEPDPFEAMFAWSDEALARAGAQRRIAAEYPGFPCRVSLEDAPVGAELLLLPYEHHAAASPYRASGPIFVRRGAARRELAPGDVPPYVTRRLISIRGYDRNAMMIAATVCEGAGVAAELDALFADPAVAYAHLHNAKRGCFSCRANRTG
jgi:hypothetical protein